MTSTSTTKPFQALDNFRDVGQSINRCAGQDLLATNRLYRSARPDFASKEDVRSLADVHHVKTILDLRTDSERIHLEEADSKDKLADLQRFNRQIVNFNGRPYQMAFMNKLSYWQTARMLAYYMTGYRKEAITIISETVLAKRGLIGLAKDSLTYCTAEVKAVFDILADVQNYPVLVHCTQGKDRTGLVVLLMLLLLDIDPVYIESDYYISDAELEDTREHRVKEIASVGLPPEFASCAPDWTEQVIGWIKEEYGDVHAYLKHCGVNEQQQQDIITLLQPMQPDNKT